MTTRIKRAIAAGAAACSVVAAAAIPPATAAVGTFTAITTPGADVQFTYVPGGANQLQIGGTASTDVSSVDIDCVSVGPFGATGQTLAAAVPVSARAFSVTIVMTHLLSNCRLRALPAGTSPSDYLGAFTGPILYERGAAADAGGYGWEGAAEQRDGITLVTDAAQCGVSELATVTVPAMHALAAAQKCAFRLPVGNLTPGGSGTASAIKVDGHNVYLPYTVHAYLIGTLGLAVTQPTVALGSSYRPNGDATWTESTVLMRCSGDDTYPPTSVSCPALVSTNVSFTRVLHFFRGGHQVSVRDTFHGFDAAKHTITLQYQQQYIAPPSGQLGFQFPAHSTGFHASQVDQTLTGFGTGSHSVLVRSDRFAAPGEEMADTTALTWSRPPARVQFSHTDAGVFGLAYAVSVPAHGVGFLGFAVSERGGTTDVAALTSAAASDMINAPGITSPQPRAVIRGHRTTVRGRLTAGANGLPASVLVNHHRAKITATSPTTATYTVTFREPFGRHALTAIATDLAGNHKAAALRVRNRA